MPIVLTSLIKSLFNNQHFLSVSVLLLILVIVTLVIALLILLFIELSEYRLNKDIMNLYE